MNDIGLKIRVLPDLNKKDFDTAVKAYESSMKPTVTAKLRLNVDDGEFGRIETSLSRLKSAFLDIKDVAGSTVFGSDSNGIKNNIEDVKRLQNEFVNLKASVKDVDFKDGIGLEQIRQELLRLDAEMKKVFSPTQYRDFVDTFGGMNTDGMFGGSLRNIRETKNEIGETTKRMVELSGAGEKIVKVWQELDTSGDWITKSLKVSDNIKSLETQLGKLKDKLQGVGSGVVDEGVANAVRTLSDQLQGVNIYAPDARETIGSLGVEIKQLAEYVKEASKDVSSLSSSNSELKKSVSSTTIEIEEEVDEVKLLESEFVNLKARVREIGKIKDPIIKKDKIKEVEKEFEDLHAQMLETFTPEQYEKFTEIFGSIDKDNLFSGLVQDVKEASDSITGLNTRVVQLAGSGQRVVRVTQVLGDDGWINRTVRLSDNVKNINTQIENLRAKLVALQNVAGDSQTSDDAQILLDKLQEINPYADNARESFIALKEEVNNLSNAFQHGETPLEKYKDALKEEYELRTKLVSLVQEKSPMKDVVETEITELERKREALRGLITNENEAKQADVAYSEAERQLAKDTEKLNNEFNKQHSLLYNIQSGWKEATARIFNYTVIYRAMWKLVQVMREAIDTTKDLNKAFTDIRMVTLYTSESTRELAKEYSSLAYELSSTLTNVASGADEWLRQGRSLAEVNDLLRASTTMARIGQLEDSEATTFLTSALKGYKIAAEDAMHVVDALSEVDMKSASSVGELAEAMQRTANVAAQSGVEFERLVGYLATMKDVSQRAAPVVGEAMKTILSRLGSVKAGVFLDEDLENEYETIEQYVNDVEKVFSKVGISIRDTNLEFREAQDVLDDVAAKWENFSDLEKNAVSTAAAGVRQREMWNVLMNNYGQALELTAAAYDSAGSSAEKYAIYENSIEASQQRINALWQEFVLNADFESVYKDLLLLAENGMKVVAFLGEFSYLIPTIITALSAFNIVLQGSGTSLLKFVFQTSSALESLKLSFMSADAAAKGFSFSLKSIPIIGWILAAISALTLLWQVAKKFNPSAEELRENLAGINNELEQAESELSAYSSQLDDIQEKIDELNKLKISGDISAVQEDELKILQDQKTELEAQIILQREKIDLLKEEQRLNAIRYYNKENQQYNVNVGHGVLVPSGMTVEKDLIKKVDMIAELQKSLEEETSSATLDTKKIEKITKDLYEARNKTLEMYENLVLIAESLPEDSEILEPIQDAINYYIDSKMSLEERVDKVLNEEKFSDAVEKIKELGQQGKLTSDELNNIDFRNLIQQLSDLRGMGDIEINFDSKEQEEAFQDVANNYKEQLNTAKSAFLDFSKYVKSKSKELGNDVVSEYIDRIFENAKGDFSLENLLSLDSDGIEIAGEKIKNVLFDVGATAENVQNKIDFDWDSTELENAYRNIKELSDAIGLSAVEFFSIISSGDVQTLNSISAVIDLLIKKFNIAVDSANDFNDAIKEMSQIEMTSQVTEKFDTLADAIAEVTKTGYLSHDMILKLSEANLKLGDNLTLTANGYKVNKADLMSLIEAERQEYQMIVNKSLQAAAKLVDAKIDEKASYDAVTNSILAKLEAQMAEAQASMQASLLKLKGLSYSGNWDIRNAINDEIKAAKDQYNALVDAKKDLETSLKNLDRFDTSIDYLLNQKLKGTSSSSGGGSSSKQDKEKETQFEKEIRILEHRQFLAQQWAQTYEKDATKQIEYQQKINEQVEIYNQLMAKTHAEANRLRSLGFSDDTEEIQQLQKQHWQYYNAKAELLKQEIEDEKEVESAYERQIRLLEHKQFVAEQWANLYQGNAHKEEEYQEKINEQIEIYGELMEAVNEETRRLRGEGFDNESAEIQEMQRKYWEYYNYRKDLIDRLYDFQKEKMEEQKRQEEEMLQKTESALSELRSAINDLIDEARERLDKILDNLDYQISKLQAMRDLTSQYHQNVNDIAQLQNDINKELAKSKTQYAYIDETLRKTLFNDQDYKKLSKKLEGIAEESEKLYNQYLQDLSNLAEDEIYKADLITAEYKRQYDLKRMEYNIAQAELNLIKAQANLQEVLANRNVRMFQNGQWTWVADYEAVKNAQDAVEDAKYNYKQAQIEKRQQEIIAEYDRMIAALEAQKQQQQAEFNALKDRWEAVQKQLTTEGDAMSRIIKIITETDLPEFRRIVGNVGGALTDIINDANSFGGGMDRVIDDIVDMIGTAADKIGDILDDMERDYGDFNWDDSGSSKPPSQGGSSGGNNGGYDDLYSTNYLKSAIEAASRGDLDLAYRYLDKRQEKIDNEGGNDRGINASQAYSMVMQEYTNPGSYTFDKYGNAIYVGGGNKKGYSSSTSSSGSSSSSSNPIHSGSSGSSNSSGNKVVWSVGYFTEKQMPNFANSTVIQRTPYGDYEVTYDSSGYVSYSKALYDKGGVLEGMGGIKATPKDETVFDSKISSMLLNPRRSQEFLNSAEALTKIMENVGGFSSLMTALESVVNSSQSVDSHDFVFNGDIVGKMDSNDFNTLSSIMKRYIPINKGVI